MRSAGVVGATMNTVSRAAERSQPATGSASSIGRSGMITPATPACAASAANLRGSCESTGLMYVISTTGTPSFATSDATSSAPATVIPFDSATWPAFWIIGSTTAAVVNLLAVDTLLTVMTKIDNPFPNLLLVPLHLPVPVLIAAALLTFARIVKAGAAMDAEIQATI